MRARLRCHEFFFSVALATILSSTSLWTDAGHLAGPVATFNHKHTPPALAMRSISWL